MLTQCCDLLSKHKTAAHSAEHNSSSETKSNTHLDVLTDGSEVISWQGCITVYLKCFIQEVCDMEERCSLLWQCFGPACHRYKCSLVPVLKQCDGCMSSLPQTAKAYSKRTTGCTIFLLQIFQMEQLYPSNTSPCCSACELKLHIIDHWQNFAKWVYCCLCRKWTLTLFKVALFLVRD